MSSYNIVNNKKKNDKNKKIDVHEKILTLESKLENYLYFYYSFSSKIDKILGKF